MLKFYSLRHDRNLFLLNTAKKYEALFRIFLVLHNRNINYSNGYLFCKN